MKNALKFISKVLVYIFGIVVSKVFGRILEKIVKEIENILGRNR